MKFIWAYISSATILFPGIAAMIRYRQIDKAYRPFLFCLWIGCLNEGLSIWMALHSIPTYVNNNIYVLIEALLTVRFFHCLGLFGAKSKTPTVLYMILIFSWIYEVFIFNHWPAMAVYFRIFYSLIIVLMSISIVNELLLRNTKSLFRHSTFLLCLCFIVFFTYKILIFSFWVYGLRSKTGFLFNIYSIMSYINALTNLLFGLAVLWMPKKLRFTLPS